MRQTFLIILLFVCVGILYAQRSNVQGGGESNMEALYHLNEASGTTANDSATDNDGTHVGTVTTDNCLWGKCRDYNGSTDYTAINSGFVMNTDAYTVSLWVNGPAGQTAMRIFMEGDTNASNHKYFCAFATDHDGLDYVTWYCRNDNLSETSTIDSTSIVFDDTWHFIAITYDGSTARLYVDGVEENTDTFSGWNRTASCSAIGAYSLGSPCEAQGIGFDGYIEEVTTYTRTLSAAEIWHKYTKKAGMY